MKTWKLVVGLALFFAFGAMVGAFGMGVYVQKKTAFIRKEPEQRKTVILQKFSDALGLSEAQKEAFKQVIDDLEKQRQQFRADLKADREAATARMRRALTPDQLKKFEAMQQEFENRKKKRFPLF